MILGNSDLDLREYIHRSGPEAFRTHKQFGLLRWNARALSAESNQVLCGLPEQRVARFDGADPIHLVHGTPRDPYESIFIDDDLSVLDLSLRMIAEPVLVCGHTHKQWYIRRDGKLAVNPGAVSGPLDGVTGAQYARMVWMGGQWQVEPRRISYDTERLKKAFVESGLLEEGGSIARSFLLSMETGINVGHDFFAHAYRLAEEAGFKDVETLPDEIFEQAGETFLWNKYQAVR